MLKPIIRQGDNIPTGSLVVATYRGIKDGWVPVGGPRTPDDAMRMLAILERLRPDYANSLVR